MPQKVNNNEPAPENVEQETISTVSEHKTKTTDNPKKNRRRQRRWQNSFDSGKLGLLLTQVAFQNDNQIQAIDKLHASLANRFDPGQEDVVAQLLIELTATDYWRMSQVGRYEKWHTSANDPTLLFCGFGVDQALKYHSLVRRNLEKSLQALLQFEKEGEAAGEFEADLDPTESQPGAAASSSQPESPSTPAQSDEPVKTVPPSTGEAQQPGADTTAPGGEAESTGAAVAPQQSGAAVPAPASPLDEASAEQKTASAPAPAESGVAQPSGVADVDKPKAA